jgi:phage terminase large subunit-like protein
MTSKAIELIEQWRGMGPIGWAESSHGWIDIDAQPIALTPWQRACLRAWEAHRDAITTLAVSNIKKTGKTALNAIVLCWRWLALPGEHFAVSNDLDQSAGRQFSMIADMVKRNAYLKRACQVTKDRIIFNPTGSTITALAVDAAGNAGANHLTASHTEAWGIIYERGIRAFEELTPPPGRWYGLPALRVLDSYAGYEGESITFHGIVDRGLAGQRIDPDWPIYRNGGLLLFHAEGSDAQRLCFRGTPDDAAAYYADQRETLRPGAFLRLHENMRATGSESFIPLEWWDRCVDVNHRPMLGGVPDVLFVGVDGSIKHDSAAVVACYFDRLAGKVVIARHRIWYPQGDALDLDSTIGDFLRELRRAYSLAEIRFDPWQMVNMAQQLTREGLPMLEYPQTVGNLTAMGQNLFDLIKSGNLIAYADDDLRQQISHAVAVESSRGWKIAKDKASLKIDAVVALAMAALAAVESGGGVEPVGEMGESSTAGYRFSNSEF